MSRLSRTIVPPDALLSLTLLGVRSDAGLSTNVWFRARTSESAKA